MSIARRLTTCASAGFVALLFAAAPQVGAENIAVSGSVRIPTASNPPPLDPKADVSAWANAASVTLGWDVPHRKAASEPATARITADDRYIYVRFDVKQRETLLAQQHTNDVGDGTDDEVWVDLWPNGSKGFYYQFAATSNGTHYQYSSENTAYAPTWTSYGASHGNDYTVTMQIPIHAMRGAGGSSPWKAQFVRIVRSTGEAQVWTYGVAQTNTDDVNYAGSMNGISAGTAARHRPRFAPYVLGVLGSPSSRLSTSRFGGDYSIPVTATSSIYGTVHPDFSNVEIDQQTISPTAYQRSFNEVRPFFTQGAGFYDHFSCDACPFIAQLYTPAIPTPRDGYAFEGKQGLFSFAGFDALGVNRNDGATALGYHTPDNHWSITAQSVAANLPGLTDHVDTAGISFNDTRHFSAYFNYGNDHGTNVLDASQAQRYDGGLYVYSNTFGFAASARKVGAYYEPVDGFVQHADINGYALYTDKIWLFDKNSPINSISLGEFMDRYWAHDGEANQSDYSLAFDVLTKSRIDVNAGIGSAYLRLPSGVFTPVSQNGVGLTWHSGTVNNPGNFGAHGASATPTTIAYNTGRFGPGRVDSWLRSSAMRAGMRGTLSLEADDTRAYEDAGATNVQWLERVGYAYATGKNSSLAVGVRRIIGTPPVVDATVLPSYTRAWNVSFAFHHRTPHDELYFAYGDASQLSTLPQLVLKLIHYFGAEKGS